MKPMFENKVMSSVKLWFDHRLLSKGEAFQNCTTRFYPTNQIYNGLYAYACPFNQLVSDSSITGANVPTGIYLNGNLIGTGVSGFHGYDFEHGRAYFTGQLPSSALISGQVAFKEFNVVLTTEPEDKILFETRYNTRPKVGQVPTGLFTNQLTYPIIFLKGSTSVNLPYAFGGQDNTSMQVSAIILTDSQFNLDALNSLFVDEARTTIPIVDVSKQPYNAYGELKTGYYNYTGLTNGLDVLCVEDINAARFRREIYTLVRQANPEVYLGLLEFTITKNRYPRLE